MAYTPKTWACGDTITAEELNRMEEGISSAQGGGGGDPGYSCTETATLLTNESVTTVASDDISSGSLAYSTPIDADTIKVTFNGTEYVCGAQDELIGKVYGAPMGENGIDWSEYPFQIRSGLHNALYTELAGTYQIKIETAEVSVETSECFNKAVTSVSSLIVTTRGTLEGSVMSETWQTIHDTLAKGAHVVLVTSDGVYAITSAIEISADSYSVLTTALREDVPTVVRYSTDSADGYPLIAR